MFLLLARELAHEDVVFVDDINTEAAKVSEPLPAILPVRRQVVRLHMTQCQSELGLDSSQDGPLTAYLGRNFIDESQCRWSAERSAP